MNPAKYAKNPGFNLLLLLIVIFGTINSLSINAQYVSKSNIRGYWTDKYSWTSGASPSLSISDANVSINGEITALNCIDLNKGTLHIYDTLIIAGDMDLKNLGRMEIAQGGVLIVFGGYTSNNKVEVVNEGLMVVRGEFRMLGADNQGYFQMPGGQLYIFDDTPDLKNGNNYVDLYCNSSTPNVVTQCFRGNYTDFMTSTSYSYYVSLEYDKIPLGTGCNFTKIIADTPKQCANDFITFHLLSLGISGDDHLTWDFGSDATPSKLEGFGPHKVSYSESGLKSIALFQNEDLFYTENNVVEIIDCRQLGFMSSLSTACLLDSIEFTDTSKGLLTSDIVSWDFGEGAIPRSATGGASHKVHYTTEGTKTVSLSLNNGLSVERLVYINRCHVLAFEGNTSSACTGDTVVYTNTSTGLISTDIISWDFGHGAEPATAVGFGPHKVVYVTEGEKDVQINLNGGEPYIKNAIVDISSCLQISFNCSTTEACAGDTIEFTNTSTGMLEGDEIEWDFGKHAYLLDDVENKVFRVMYAKEGPKTVALRINNGLPLSKQNIVTIKNCRNLDFEVDYKTVCVGDWVRFTNHSSKLTPLDYVTWDFGEGASPLNLSGKGPFSVLYNTPGLKDITLSVVDDTFLVKPQLVSVSRCPQLDFGVDITEACVNDTLHFSQNIQGLTAIDTLIWDFGENAIPAKAIGPGPYSVFYTKEGTYDVTLALKSGLVSDLSNLAYINISSCDIKELIDTESYTFTPNNDGYNDTWIIENIAYYPEAVVTVYNRAGKRIYRSDGAYQNNWDGTYNGIPLTLDSYYFVIDLSAYGENIVNGIVTILK